MLAFAIRHLGADAGVMVTASHNPPQDNGYKVYLGDGSQIVPPADAEIAAAHRRRRAPVADVPLRRRRLGDARRRGRSTAYLDAVAGRRPRRTRPRDLARRAHPAARRRAATRCVAALRAAGLRRAVRRCRARPSRTRTSRRCAFPNPEEPGAIDAALAPAARARRRHRDRQRPGRRPVRRRGAATSADGGWRMLRGDEVGALLGRTPRCARGVAGGRGRSPTRSCRRGCSRRIAAAAGIRHEETLTGFKWIARVPGLRYGYEEALGYCVDPDIVRDKDGVSAALLLAELAAALKAQGRTLLDVLDDLAVEHGVHATDALVGARRRPGPDRRRSWRGCATAPPTALGRSAGRAQLDDLAAATAGCRRPTGCATCLADGSRVIVRPRGTEPKLKVLPRGHRAGAGPARTARRAAADASSARLAAMRATASPWSGRGLGRRP